MKSIAKFLILLLVILLLCSCTEKEGNSSVPSEELIIFPTGEMADTVNGYRVDSNPNIKDESEDKYLGNYIANNSTKKFHKASCNYAINADESKITVTNDRQELLNKGYSPCKKCNP